ncbi:MAG: CotH kinase family protein [Eubacteriales bacterium]|nr:CotH kinase family protein [Eubacteriales bacterium]
MRGKEKSISLLLSLILIISGLFLFDKKEEQYYFPEVSSPAKAETTDLSAQTIEAKSDFDSEEHIGVVGKTNYRSKEIRVDTSFTSNLPLIVIDTGDQEPRRGVVWNSEKGYYVPTGEDPYAYGEISIINNTNGINRIDDAVALHSLCKVKLRGNSSGNYDKKQYLLKLTDEEGKAKKKNILGMGSDSEWILNVSFIDKSLLRNYLAYEAIGEIMPYTPDVQFCEVIWKDKAGYRYEGVYLMMESIKVGKDRVDLPKYSENSDVTPALLRRDRYNENGLMLDNYATQNGLTSGYLDIEYPDKKDITEKGIQNITKQVNRFEEALYADSWDEFVKYRDYIDMQSFVDYFILNEFFLNYDAGYNSTYVYMNYSGKLTMGPVWDFDQAMDNNEKLEANLYTTAFHSAPWFDQLLRDPVFTDALIKRYAELRKSILADESIKAFVIETIAYLGDAIKRDWARWGYYYIDGNYLKTDFYTGKDRNTKTYQEEVEKILNALSVHGRWMDEHLDSLYQFKMLSLEDAQAWQYQAESKTERTDYSSMLAVLFVLVFLISVKLVLKHESE